MRLYQAVQVHVGQIVAADDQERIVAKKVLNALDAACVSPELFFPRPTDFDAPFRAISEVLFDLIAEIVQIDHDLVEAMLLEQFDQILHNGAIEYGDERFGDSSGQGVQARTDPCGQYHGFHEQTP